MPNLTDLSANSKHPELLSSNLRFLTSGLSGVVVTIGQIMEKERITDEEYDQMCMIIMALQRAITHIEFDWPDCGEETGLEMIDFA